MVERGRKDLEDLEEEVERKRVPIREGANVGFSNEQT